MKKLTRIFLFLLLLSFNMVIADAGAHKNSACYYCHETKGYSFGEESDTCGDCHMYGRDKALLEEGHNPKICKTCHNGDHTEYHTLHKNVTCGTCHGTGRQLPEETTSISCASCHGGKIHELHSNCPDCHGPVYDINSKNLNKPSVSSTKYVKEINYQKYSILEIIKRLFKEPDRYISFIRMLKI
jgi:DnaJ-class molecular chaperone